jgi:ribosomal protein S18 acetylase RimI-like enzyme
MNSVSISEVHEVDLDVVSAFNRLVPQLSSSSPPPTADHLAEMVAHDGTTLFVARADGDATIIGTLTLIVFRIPTALRAHIDDVIVDSSVRGRGLRTGEALIAAAVEKAKAQGCKTLDLTSRPARVDAHRLYERTGFKQRETNVYRMELE